MNRFFLRLEIRTNSTRFKYDKIGMPIAVRWHSADGAVCGVAPRDASVFALVSIGLACTAVPATRGIINARPAHEPPSCTRLEAHERLVEASHPEQLRGELPRSATRVRKSAPLDLILEHPALATLREHRLGRMSGKGARAP